MSPGISLLTSKGAQDAHLELKNDDADGISFFNQVFRKHTPFSSNIEKQYIQGQPKTGGLSKITCTKVGDCLGYTYFTMDNGAAALDSGDWASIFSEVSLYIGGELIDRHDGVFCETAAIDLFAQSASKSALGPHPGASSNSFFFPLRFFFCESTMAALPLCAIKQEVEIEIRWGTVPAGANFECYSMMYYLGAVERSIVANSEEGRDMLIFQVQKSPASNDLTQDLVFNHPVRFICTANTADASPYKQANNKLKIQINGEDVTPFRFARPNYMDVPHYYHTQHVTSPDIFMYPFCLTTSLNQPCGSLNASRVTDIKIISESLPLTDDVYAVSWNWLYVKNGYAALRYAN